MSRDPAAGGPSPGATRSRRAAVRVAGAALGLAAVAVVVFVLAAGSTEPSTTTAGPDPASSGPTAPAPSASVPMAEPGTTASTAAPAPTTTEPPVTLTDPWWAYKGNLDGPRVLVVGDSITDQATEEIEGLLRPDYATQVIGLSGFELAEAAPYLEPYPPTRPDVVVIELGTNDGNAILADTSGARRDEWKATLLGYRDLFPGTCFVPVTMPASRDYPAWNDSQQELNDWLLATFPATLDWNGFELGERAAGNRLLIHDLIHPDTAGEAALAELYRAGVERCLR